MQFSNCSFSASIFTIGNRHIHITTVTLTHARTSKETKDIVHASTTIQSRHTHTQFLFYFFDKSRTLKIHQTFFSIFTLLTFFFLSNLCFYFVFSNFCFVSDTNYSTLHNRLADIHDWYFDLCVVLYASYLVCCCGAEHTVLLFRFVCVFTPVWRLLCVCFLNGWNF